MSKVKDSSLAEQGKLLIELAEGRMGALLEVQKQFVAEKPFAGLTIGLALHVTKETAVLVKTLVAGGAEVAIAGCNPLSTQDAVAAALAVESGVEVFAWKHQTNQEYYDNLKSVISVLQANLKPTAPTAPTAPKTLITIDDGCDLVSLIHKEYPALIPHIIGGCEETTTGIVRLQAMVRAVALKYPVVAVNDNKTKHLMDNYYGTGQSTLDGIIRATNILLAGKILVVVGYGSCGKGVSKRAQGMGSNVIVVETDAFRALQAVMDGYRVMPLLEAAVVGDIFVTVTGNKHVIRPEHMARMKSGAILANSGHFDLEIDLVGLKKMSSGQRTMRPFLDEYILENKKLIFVVGEGRLVNLAAAEGHPSEVMSLSFCGQALACYWLVNQLNGLRQAQAITGLEAKLYTLPPEIDDRISQLQLMAMGVTKDTITHEQQKYLTSWEEGT